MGELVVPEGHVDDVGCPCGPVVHPVAGLMHSLVADGGWTTTSLGVLSATRPVGRRVRISIDHPGQIDGRPALGQVVEGTLDDLGPSDVSSVYYSLAVRADDGTVTELNLPLSHPVELGSADGDVAMVRETVAVMRAELAEWEDPVDAPSRRFFAATVRLIEMATDDAAAVEAMNARTRERADRVGGDGHTWVMHRPEWAVALDAARAYREGSA